MKHYSLFIIFICSHTHADIFKCIDQQNKVIYTDQPCETPSEAFTPPSIMTNYKHVTIDTFTKIKKLKSKPKETTCPFISTTEMRNLRVKQEYKTGLPKIEITKRFGAPNETASSGSNNETWIYKNKKYKLEFKFKNGCLSHWKEKWFGKKSPIDKYRDF